MSASLRTSVVAAGASLYGGAAFAFADAPLVQKSLTGNTEALSTPGIGRIVAAFIVTLIVGGAFVWLLRRALPFLPKWGGTRSVASAMNVKASQAITPSLRLHVVEVDGATVLIAEGRSGVCMTAMPGSAQSANGSTSVGPPSDGNPA